MKRKAAKFYVLILLCIVCVLRFACVLNATEIENTDKRTEPGTLNAKSAVIMDGDSGRILYEKDGYSPMAMASTTKIMTCIVALENGKLDMLCTASRRAAAAPKVHLGMKENDTFYLNDLLYALMLESYNDCAIVIAENVGGSVENFAVLMNEKAKEIGCTDTYFITPNGLDDKDDISMHHTTAADLALIMRYCISQSEYSEKFIEITSTKNYSFMDGQGKRSYSCSNHNQLLNMYEGAISGKTGFTGMAGYCYVGAVEIDGETFIIALLASGWPPNKTYKWKDARKLISFGLENYQYKEIYNESWNNSIPVTGGAKNFVNISGSGELEMLMASWDEVRIYYDYPKELKAPVYANQLVGHIYITINNVVWEVIDLKTTEEVKTLDFEYYMDYLINKLLLFS